MKLIDKLVAKNLKLNKKRTIVTVMGIILAVALLAALSTLVMSFRSSLIEYEKSRNGDFHVKFMGLNSEQLEELNRNVCLENFYYTKAIGYAKLEGCANPDKPYAFIMATGREGLEKLSLKLLEGRFPEKDNEIVIPRHLKTNGRLDIKVGETISLEVGTRIDSESGSELSQYRPYMTDEFDKLIDTTSKTYTVVGICERPGTRIEGYYAPGYTFVTYEDVKPANGNKIEAYARFTAASLSKYCEVLAKIIGCDVKGLEVQLGESAYDKFMEVDWDKFNRDIDNSPYSDLDLNTYLIKYERLWPIDDSLLTVMILGAFVAAIIIFTSVYCIKNSFEISVAEKIRQYGMLAGIGATKKQIKQCVRTEAAIMGCVGIPLGIASGLFAAFVLIKITNVLLSDALRITLSYTISLPAVIVAILLGCLTIYLSSVSGARKAAKITPVEAIRNNNEIKSDKKSKTPALVSKLWGIGGVVSYKNIKRNRKKYRTTVVSIAICTVTFIVISYFMSMMYSMVGISVSDNECNLYSSHTQELQFERVFRDLADLEGVEKLTVHKRKMVDVSTSVYTPEYMERCMNGYGSDEAMLEIIVLDAASYKKYLSQLGAGNMTGKAVLVNNQIIPGYGEVDTFACKKGEKLEFSQMDYSINEGENETEKNEKRKVKSSLEIGAVTTVRPFGCQDNIRAFLVIDEELFKEIPPIRNCDTVISLKTAKADANQDTLTNIFESDSTFYGTNYYIYNEDKNTREIKSLFTLLAIFAYGLITVIALIGVTNTVNTIGTGMELRAREFAMLRSVGMTNGQFERMVRLESLFISAKALFWGCLIGIGLSVGIWKFEVATDLVIPYKPPIGAALMCVVVVLLLVYSIIRISLARINKRNIIDTIKNENM